MQKRRNKRKERAKRNADNRFTEFTGIKPIRLSGSADCWVVSQTLINRLPPRKIAYAAFNGWQKYQSVYSARRMKQLRVKQSCGVDQCVNPEHLVGIEKPFEPWK